MEVLPQFPLGTVLFPSMVLPLHVFEPRYRALVNDILDGDRSFGVVLIEKGRDVGGDDQRSGYGTVARILEAEQFPDGRWAVIAVGMERFKVTEWLADDPYPRAAIERWPDDEYPLIDAGEVDRVESKFRRCVALASEAGVDVGGIPDEFSDGAMATMQMSTLLPVGSFDKQRLLGVSGAVERLVMLEKAIDETMDLINVKLLEG